MKKNTLKSLQIRNLLSFGEDSPEIRLGDLNVLIGPNGSGKSNLIEIVGLLRNTPKDFAAEVGDSGGVADWLWKGKSKDKASKTTTATIYATADPTGVNKTISYSLSFTRVGSQLKITDERIENAKPDEGHDKPYLYFNFNGGRPVLNVAGNPRSLKREEVDPQRSILSQRQDPDQYPEVTYLGRFFGSFRLYRNWDFGPDSGLRDLYGAGQRNDFLEEDASNLGLMLNKLRAEPGAKSVLLEHLKMFYSGAEDYIVLLVDSEEAVAALDHPWQHLNTRMGDNWRRPSGAQSDQAHLMVQAMESWFLADQQTLADYYGQGFLRNSLPGQPDNRTDRQRGGLQSASTRIEALSKGRV